MTGDESINCACIVCSVGLLASLVRSGSGRRCQRHACTSDATMIEKTTTLALRCLWQQAIDGSSFYHFWHSIQRSRGIAETIRCSRLEETLSTVSSLCTISMILRAIPLYLILECCTNFRPPLKATRASTRYILPTLRRSTSRLNDRPHSTVVSLESVHFWEHYVIWCSQIRAN